MTFEQIMQDLQNKKYSPIYLLMGEETYFIDQISNYIMENVLSEADQSFNQTVVYGKDADVKNIDSMAKRFPMMSTHQVVVIKEAQELKGIEELAYYCGKPLQSTILVLCHKYKSLQKNKKLYKACAKNGVVLEAKKLYDNQVPAWIGNYLKAKNISIDPQASAMLTEFLGTGLSKIANELDKLHVVLPEGSKITAEVIEKNIGISKDYNTFELQKAIGNKEILKVNRIINHFAQNPKEHNIIQIVTTLFNYFQKLLKLYFIKELNKQTVASAIGVHPFFAQEYLTAKRKYSAGKIVEIISILREYDLKSKGVNNVSAEHGELLREMVYKIMH